MSIFNRYFTEDDASLKAMRERERLARMPLFFKGMLVVLVGVFMFEVVFFTTSIGNTKRFFDELRENSLMASSPRRGALHEGLDDDDEIVTETVFVPNPVTPIVRYHVSHNWQNILRSRDPFSDTTYAEGDRRQKERMILLVKREQSSGYYSILRDDNRSETGMHPNVFAYILKDKPPLPAPDLENIQIEGAPPESPLASPSKATCRFTWKGMICRNEAEYYFVGDDEHTYSGRTGENIEGYHIQAKEKSSLVLMKDGDVYSAKKRSPL